jgi:predicted dinucleotide-binding enzyme
VDSSCSRAALGTTTGAEAVKRWALGHESSKVFRSSRKSFVVPTGNRGKPAGSFMCGDDEPTKALVRPLTWALLSAVVDVGPLENTRRHPEDCLS